jgi:hypothetical protein
MKKNKFMVMSAILMCNNTLASISDPVSDFRSRNTTNGALCKIVFDWNNDSKNDVFICQKSHYEESKESGETISWTAYLTQNINNEYILCEGKEYDENGEQSISDGAIPNFDPEQFFVGSIPEINKFGLVTCYIENPKEGDPIAYVFALVLTGGIFKEYEIAKYNAKEENALYDKYLKDDKRTQLTIEQIPEVEEAEE